MMSEIGYISKKYNKISRLTDDINSASISVKKHALKHEQDVNIKYPGNNVIEQVYTKSKDVLIHFLHSLIQLIDDGKTESEDITMLTDNKVYQEQITGNPSFKKNVIAILERLESDQVLSINQFKLLDTLISVLDNERSFLFRKMRNI